MHEVSNRTANLEVKLMNLSNKMEQQTSLLSQVKMNPVQDNSHLNNTLNSI